MLKHTRLRTATTRSKALTWLTTVPVVSSSSGIIPSPHPNPRRILLVCLHRVPIQPSGRLRPFFRSLPANRTVVSEGNILLSDAMRLSQVT